MDSALVNRGFIVACFFRRKGVLFTMVRGEDLIIQGVDLPSLRWVPWALEGLCDN